MGGFSFSPETYLDRVLVDGPCIDEMQERLAAETRGLRVERALELGVGTGETTRRVLAVHPGARIVGIDASQAMLAQARRELPAERVELLLARLQDPLPSGEFDLVYSALAVHHLAPNEKATLFRRAARALRPAGRLVLADLVLPEQPEDAVSPVTDGLDRPDSVADQLRWLAEAGLEAHQVWAWRDFALLSASRPVRSSRSV
ncbi:MAG: class I SAM-dependent methyltransferase [Gaiellaceae bacterium]